ncbi:MAG: hypothetical protein AB7O96_08915 [Pseudobdellovibrionaceae bacterium]
MPDMNLRPTQKNIRRFLRIAKAVLGLVLAGLEIVRKILDLLGR